MATTLDDLAKLSVAASDSDRIRAVLSAVCDLTGMGFAAVAWVTDSRWIACQVVDRIAFGLASGEELALKTTICDEIRQSGRMVVIDHVGANPEWRTHHTPVLYGFESYVALPIILADGEFFGTLCAIDNDERRLSVPALLETLSDYAHEIATILQTRIDGLASPAAVGAMALPIESRP